MAKKKAGQIAIKDLEAALKDDIKKVVAVEWRGLQIEVKKCLDLDDVHLFVNKVADSCFSEDLSFEPWRTDFLIRSITIALYTNLNLPDDIRRVYDICYAADLYHTICENINYDQFVVIERAIYDKIQYICSVNADFVRKQMLDATASLGEISSSITDAFGDVSREDIENIAKAIAEGGIDETKLMEAYMGKKYPKAE